VTIKISVENNEPSCVTRGCTAPGNELIRSQAKQADKQIIKGPDDGV
jgi:hypothetical protein